MALVLGIDTSSVDLGVALISDSGPVASISRFERHSHAEHISSAVEMLLRTHRVAPLQVDHISISVGPGSFTGLRIGIAFVKGFCMGRAVGVLPVSSLETVAQARAGHGNNRIIVAIDARRDDVFWAAFEFREGVLVRLSPDTITTVEQFRDQLGESDTVVTDTMGYVKSTVFSFLGDRPNTFPVERYPVHRGLACAQIGTAALAHPDLWRDPVDILPNYLRSSAAQVAKGR